MYVVIKSVLFTLLFIGAVALFLHVAFGRFRAMMLGRRGEQRSGDLLRRLGHLIYYGILQRRVASAGGSIHHLAIFWGFLVLMIGNLAFVAGGIHPGLTFDLLGERAALVLRASQDLMALVVLAALAVALFRRVVLRPKHIEALSRDAFVIIGLIAVLMVAMLLATGLEIAMGELAPSPWLPGARTAAGWFSGSKDTLFAWHEVLWWVHGVVLLFFLNYLPFSKHLHIIGALPNVFLRRLGFPTDLARIDFETSEQFGATKVTDFTWKQLLDGYACTQCGRCDNNCPAWNTDKPLSPKHIINDTKDSLNKHAKALLAGRRYLDLSPAPADAAIEGLVGYGQITEDALWSCTTCGACMEQCPVFIEHVPKIVDLRRSQVLMESKFPSELNAIFKDLETNGNPYAMAATTRAKWTEGLEVPLWSDHPEAEYLFWVGCAGSFDDRNRRTSRALVQCLQAAGVSFAILGPDERCCGDSARRLGNEYLFTEMATANVELLNGLGVKKIVTACPHGLNTLRNEYPAFGGQYQVIHHSELLAELLAAGRLPVQPGAGLQVAFHDSCYLGRYNHIYAQPRAALRAVGAQVREMRRHGRISFCCGAGGGRMWLEETLGRRINAERTAEALRTGAQAIAVACPFCLTMLADGVKDAGAEKVAVQDIAEIIAAHLQPA